MPELEQFLTIKDEKGIPIAAFYNDIKNKCTRIFTCSEKNIDEIKEMLENIAKKATTN